MDQLPRADTALTGDAAVSQVKHTVSQKLGWVFRDMASPDFGIDGQIEVIAEISGAKVATGRVFAVQVKGGPSFFRQGDSATGWTVYISQSTVRYWRLHSLPVLLVLANLETGESFWARGDIPDLEATEQNYKIQVPRSQRLDASAIPALLDLTAGTFVTTDRMFGEALSSQSTFNHSRHLEGRQEELNAVIGAFEDHDVNLVLVGGRGGIGKSRLLIEAAREVEARGWTVRWVAGDVAIRPETALELPPGSVAIIVDDAHRRNDLAAVLRLATDRPERTKLLIGTRPWGRPVLQSAMRDALVDSAQVRDIGDLSALGESALRSLVQQELGPAMQDFADAVVTILGDSTLVALVGARLLRTQQIPLAFLERNETFRQEVIGRFGDAILGDFGRHIDGGRAKQLLRLLSVTGPVEVEDAAWLEQAAAFLNIRRSELVELLGEMEEAGVLGRRAGRLRVIPDLLADHLVHQAIVNAVGSRTGYEREVFGHFGISILKELTANLAELDWRLEEADLPTGAFDDVWAHLVDYFRTSNNEHRIEILQALLPVAVMRPKHVLDLCEWITVNPEGDERGTYFRCTDTRVLAKVTPILERIAIHPDWFDSALDLLWTLGRDEPVIGFREKGEILGRIEELGSYHPQKPLWVQVRALRRLQGWTAEPGWAEHIHLPLGLGEELLEKEKVLTHREGTAIVMTGFPFSVADAIETRLATVRLLGELSRGASARGRLAAIESLLKGLAPPSGYFGHEVGVEEIQAWAPQDLAILDELVTTLETTEDPLVLITVKDRLAWIEYRAVGETRRRCHAIRTGIRETNSTTVVRAYGQVVQERMPRREEDGSKRVDRELRREKNLIHAAATHLRDRYPRPSELLAALAELDARFTNAGREAQAFRLYAELARPCDELAVGLVEGLARNEQALGSWLGAPLGVLREVSPDAYRPIARLALDSEHSVVRRAYAGSLQALAWGEGWTPEDADHVERLLQDDDPRVRLTVTKALGRAGIAREVRLRLLRRVRIEGHPDVAAAFADSAKELFQNVDEPLPREVVHDLLDRLVEVPRLEGNTQFGVPHFLETVARQWPHLLVAFIVRRFELEVVQNEDVDLLSRNSYEAVPTRGWDRIWAALRTSTGYGEGLRALRDLAVRAEGVAAFRAADVWGELAGADETAAACLVEWLKSEEPDLFAHALILLDQLPKTFVLEMPAAVAQVLEAAAPAGHEVVESVASALRTSVRSDIGIRQVGKPHPGDEIVVSTAIVNAAGFPNNSLGHRFYTQLADDARRRIQEDLDRDARSIDEG